LKLPDSAPPPGDAEPGKRRGHLQRDISAATPIARSRRRSRWPRRSGRAAPAVRLGGLSESSSAGSAWASWRAPAAARCSPRWSSCPEGPHLDSRPFQHDPADQHRPLARPRDTAAPRQTPAGMARGERARAAGSWCPPPSSAQGAAAATALGAATSGASVVARAPARRSGRRVRRSIASGRRWSRSIQPVCAAMNGLEPVVGPPRPQYVPEPDPRPRPQTPPSGSSEPAAHRGTGWRESVKPHRRSSGTPPQVRRERMRDARLGR